MRVRFLVRAVRVRVHEREHVRVRVRVLTCVYVYVCAASFLNGYPISRRTCSLFLV